ncbi:MAG: AAA family ATPase [Colwellia sp.]|nr:AAA family ATPase [Colwellia sp.]
MNIEKHINNRTSLIVVMGVSGSGKSHLASKLSTALDFNFVEADDFHSDTSKKSMAANIALSDEVRQCWFELICHHLNNSVDKNIVLAFSGLKYKHRKSLRKLKFNTLFIWLDGDPEVIKQRLSKRKNHFVSADFLSGQLKKMEPPVENEGDTFRLDIDNKIAEMLTQCLQVIDVHHNI